MMPFYVTLETEKNFIDSNVKNHCEAFYQIQQRKLSPKLLMFNSLDDCQKYKRAMKGGDLFKGDIYEVHYRFDKEGLTEAEQKDIAYFSQIITGLKEGCDQINCANLMNSDLHRITKVTNIYLFNEETASYKQKDSGLELNSTWFNEYYDLLFNRITAFAEAIPLDENHQTLKKSITNVLTECEKLRANGRATNVDLSQSLSLVDDLLNNRLSVGQFEKRLELIDGYTKENPYLITLGKILALLGGVALATGGMILAVSTAVPTLTVSAIALPAVACTFGFGLFAVGQARHKGLAKRTDELNHRFQESEQAQEQFVSPSL